MHLIIFQSYNITRDVFLLFIYDLFAGAYHSWIGGTDVMEENTWRWQNSGRIIKLAGWLNGQSNGGTAENCLLTIQTHEHRWVDNPCKNKYPYVCEKHGELETIDFECK